MKLKKTLTFEVEHVDVRRLANHIYRKFQKAYFPSIVHAFDDSKHRVSSRFDIGQHSITNGFHVIVEDSLGDMSSFKNKALLKENRLEFVRL